MKRRALRDRAAQRSLRSALDDILREATNPSRPTGWSWQDLDRWTNDLTTAIEREA